VSAGPNNKILQRARKKTHYFKEGPSVQLANSIIMFFPERKEDTLNDTNL
jgi:hypothetical protein